MTREEAIERLIYLRDEIMPLSSTMFNALTMAIKALEEPQWIPCSERLPEAFQQVFVTYITEDRLSVDITRYGVYGGGFRIGNVIAWMPLPKPYREGGEEND